MHLVKVNKNGQVSIPARIRKKLSLAPGGFLQVEETSKGKIVLAPITFATAKSKKEATLKKLEREGVDLSLLQSHLNMTPTERLENLRQFQKFIVEVEKNRLGKKIP